LQPSPARSYEHTRANFETPDCTRLHSTEKSPMPASKITVGCDELAFPVQFRWRRHPPTSTNRPGAVMGGDDASTAFCAGPLLAATKSATTPAVQREKRVIGRAPQSSAMRPARHTPRLDCAPSGITRRSSPPTLPL